MLRSLGPISRPANNAMNLTKSPQTAVGLRRLLRCYPGAQKLKRAWPAFVLLFASLSSLVRAVESPQPTGRFEFSDRIGADYTLTLGADQSYELIVFLEPPGSQARGRVKVVGTRLHLEPAVGTLAYLEIIRWGGQIYLATPADIPAFCARARVVATQPTTVVRVAGVFAQRQDKKGVHPSSLPSICVAGSEF